MSDKKTEQRFYVTIHCVVATIDFDPDPDFDFG